MRVRTIRPHLLAVAILLAAAPVPALPPDLDSSDRVDGPDLIRFSRALGSADGEARWDPVADLDLSGLVGEEDLTILTRYFGLTGRVRRIWVLSSGGGLNQIARDGTLLGSFGSMYSPVSVALDQRDASLWILDSGQTQVLHFSAKGALLATIEGFSSPDRVDVFSGDGTVWVSDSGDNLVYRIDPGIPDGYDVSVDTDSHTTTDVFENPISLSVDQGTGMCWVADSGAGAVVRLLADGSAESLRLEGFSQPVDVAAYPVDGSCWIADRGVAALVQVDADGQETYRKAGITAISSVAVDPASGSCVVAGTGSSYYKDGTVSKYSSEGSNVFTLSGFATPVGLFPDPSTGCTWVADYSLQTVYKLNPDGSKALEIAGLYGLSDTTVDPGYPAGFQQPTASAICDALTGEVPLTVTFGGAAEDPDGSILHYQWDFDGDGVVDHSSETTSTVSHTFTNSGVYNVIYRVVDDQGLTALDSRLVVRAGSLAARAFADPTEGATPLTVNFTGQFFDPVDDQVENFQWDFDGNGVFEYFSETNPDTSHVYADEGTYEAVFKVTDTGGLTAADSVTITVTPASPSVSASAAPASGEAPLEVKLQGTASDPDGEIVLYQWDFDADGTYDWSSTSGGTTWKQFDTRGTYDCVFKATDDDGLTATATLTVEVQGQAPFGTLEVSPSSGDAPLSVDLSATVVGSAGPVTDHAWLLTGAEGFVDDLEGGTFAWIADMPWTLTASESFSGTYAWSACPQGQCPAGTDASLYLPPQTFSGPTVYTGNCRISFWHRYDFPDSGDYGIVEYSVNDGQSWYSLKNITGVSRGWERAVLDLSVGAGVEVGIRFRLKSDTDDQLARAWLIDDVRFVSMPPAEDDPGWVSTGDVSETSHTYDEPGRYVAVVRFTDDVGTAGYEWAEVEVLDPDAPHVTAQADPEVGEAPLSVSFTGQVQGGAAINLYEWIFGEDFGQIRSVFSQSYAGYYSSQAPARIAWNPATDHLLLASASDGVFDQGVAIFDAANGSLLGSLNQQGLSPVSGETFGTVAVSPSGRIFTQTRQGGILYWSSESAQPVVALPEPDTARYALGLDAIETGGSTYVYSVGTENREVDIYRLDGSSLTFVQSVDCSVSWYTTVGSAIAVKADGSSFFVSSSYGVVTQWDSASGPEGAYERNEDFWVTTGCESLAVLNTPASGDSAPVLLGTSTGGQILFFDADGERARQAYPVGAGSSQRQDIAVDESGKRIFYTYALEGYGALAYTGEASTSSDSDPNASHTFDLPGLYRVLFRATAADGLSGEDVVAVHVTAAPTVSILAPPPNATMSRLGVPFMVLGHDSDGLVVLYEWDFDGDGAWDFSSETDGNTTWDYAAPGDYTARVRVTDNDGLTGEATVGLTIIALSPEVTISATPAEGRAPLVVGFKGDIRDPDGDPVSVAWDFDGDGSTDQTNSGPAGSVVSATSSRDAENDVAHLIDGQVGSGYVWRTNGALGLPQEVVLELEGGQTHVIDRLALNLERSLYSGYGLKEFELLASAESASSGFSSLLTTATVSNQNWQVWDLPPTSARFVKLRVLDSFNYYSDEVSVDELVLFAGGENVVSPVTPLAVHTYDAPGFFDAALRVTDDQGLEGNAATKVTVHAAASPSVSITQVTPNPALVNQTVTFTCTASGYTWGIGLASYEWDFDGDGSWDVQSDSSNPTTWTYAAPGVFTALLRVTDTQGISATGRAEILVEPEGRSVGALWGSSTYGDWVRRYSSLAYQEAEATLDGPSRLAVDFGSHDVWVAHSSGTGLSQYAPDGSLLSEAGAGLLSYPAGLSRYPADGSLWVLDSGTDEVLKLSGDASSLQGRITGLGDPVSLAVDPNTGKCWIAERTGDRVLLVSPDIPSEYDASTTGLLHSQVELPQDPVSLTVDPADGTCLVVVGYYAYDLYRLSQEGQILQQIPVNISIDEVTVNPSDSSIWLICQSDHRLLRLAADGSLIVDSGAFDFSMVGLAVDPLDGGCWTVNNTSRRLVKFGAGARYGIAVSTPSTPDRLAYDPGYNEQPGAPTVEASASVLSGGAPLTVSLGGTATDSGGSITLYEWDFDGDGLYEYSSTDSPVVDHTYDEAGAYVPVLRVTDNDGLIACDYHLVIRVGEPAAFLTVDQSEGAATFRPTFTFGGTNLPIGVTYELDYEGDGVYDTAYTEPREVSHSYYEPGQYTALLRVSGEGIGLLYAAVEITVTPSPPQARASFTPADLQSPVLVNFSASGSSDSDGSIVLYEWDFDGDGLFDYASRDSWEAGYYYASPGQYKPMLRVTDNDGLTGTAAMAFAVTNSPPTALFSLDPEEGSVPLGVVFDGSASNDPDGDIAVYEWDLDGDGAYETSSTSNAEATWEYTTPGVYTVRLRVRDAAGAGDAAAARVTAKPAGAPTVELTANPEAGRVPLLVEFDAAATDDGSIEQWVWDFGQVRHTNTYGYVTDLLMLGSWPATGIEDISSSMTGVVDAWPDPGDVNAGKQWFVFEPSYYYDDFVVVSWNEAFALYQGYNYAYSMAYFHVAEDTDIRISYSMKGSARFWVNGVLAAAQVGDTYAARDEYNFETTFSAGWNRVLLAVAGSGYNWASAYRILGLDGEPLDIPYTLRDPRENPPILTQDTYEAPEYLFEDAGATTVTVTVYDDTGTSDTDTVLVTPYATFPPRAIPRAYPTVGVAPLTVNFYSNGEDSDGTIDTFLWDFDNDGIYDAPPAGSWDRNRPSRVSHTFFKPGVYQATLTVTDFLGASDSAPVTIYVAEPGGPEANAQASPDDGEAPLEVTLTGWGSVTNGRIVQYEWDFENDGVFDWSSTTTPEVTHVYDTAGFHTAVLRVTDDQGRTGVDTVPVDAKAPGSPTVTLDVDSDSGSAPLTVTFDASAEDPGGRVVSLEWDLDGDGVYESKSQFQGVARERRQYTYSSAGVYEVVVRVTDNAGNIDYARHTIDLEFSLALARSRQAFDPTQGETVTLSTALTGATSMTMRVVDRFGETVRVVVDQEQREAGFYPDVWDGRNASGDFVDHDAYYVVIAYTRGGQTRYLDLTNSVDMDGDTPSVTYPTTFNPIEDRPFFAQYTLREPAEVSIYVHWAPGSSPQYPVKTVVQGDPRPSGNYVDVWYGTNDNGDLVGPGQYSMGVWVWYLPDNAVIAASRPIISDVLKEPDYFSPAWNPYAASRTLTISYRLSKAATVFVDIETAEGFVLKSLEQTHDEKGQYSIEWDGKTDEGWLPEPGVYKIVFRAEDAFGNRSITSYSVFKIFY